VLDLINKMYTLVGTTINDEYIEYFSDDFGPLSLNDSISEVEQYVSNESDSPDDLFDLLGTSTLSESIDAFFSILGSVDLLGLDLVQSIENIYARIGDLEQIHESLIDADPSLVSYVEWL
jgi:hypothetical protein